MKFELDADQRALFASWARELKVMHPEPPTAIGGRYSFCFVPTSIGNFVTVKDCMSGKELDLTGNL